MVSLSRVVQLLGPAWIITPLHPDTDKSNSFNASKPHTGFCGFSVSAERWIVNSRWNLPKSDSSHGGLDISLRNGIVNIWWSCLGCAILFPPELDSHLRVNLIINWQGNPIIQSRFPIINAVRGVEIAQTAQKFQPLGRSYPAAPNSCNGRERKKDYRK